ncbi:hypothetical protein [Streptomyces sp. NPDC047525]|uniref:hypothetical protein n=1 Tax=Streptomyces sp. NPDC047525 TaxID=3155264 RepID=UPI0033F6122D
MSTAPTDKQPPFDAHAFPQELLDAQRRAAELHAEIHEMQKRLPWSREPQPGWEAVTEQGRERAGRAPSPGWDPDDAKAYDKLQEDRLEATAFVNTHKWWRTCRENGVEGPALVAARQALKHAKGAVLQEADEQTA